MSEETLYDTRNPSQEDEYFFSWGRKILERQDAAGRMQAQRAELAAALGVPLDQPAVDVLLGAFVTPESAEAVAWLPVIQLGWIEGMTFAERNAIERLAALPKPLRPQAADQITWWCVLAPPPAVYEAGRAVLRYRLAPLRPAAREEACTRLLQACDAIARAERGFLWVRAVSPAERAARHALVLALDAAT